MEDETTYTIFKNGIYTVTLTVYPDGAHTTITRREPASGLPRSSSEDYYITVVLEGKNKNDVYCSHKLDADLIPSTAHNIPDTKNPLLLYKNGEVLINPKRTDFFLRFVPIKDINKFLKLCREKLQGLEAKVIAV